MTAALTTSHRQDQLARLRAAMVAPSGRVVLVNVPMGSFLMIDGEGAAGGETFRAAVRTLADLSAALRLYLQEGCSDLLDPMPVEILWYSGDDDAWREALPQAWAWTAMVAQPASVTPELLAAVRMSLPLAMDIGALRRVHLGSLREGWCAQTAYAGRAERSEQVLERVRDHVRAHGLEPHGPHHEIYVADLRHRDAGPLRTIVRQPVRRAT